MHWRPNPRRFFVGVEEFYLKGACARSERSITDHAFNKFEDPTLQ